MEAQSPTLAEIAAVQGANPIFAYDRGLKHRTLVRLQSIYVAKLAQYEAFVTFFDEGQPNIVLRSASQELALRLPACQQQMSEIYCGLRDALADELRKPEGKIVGAHIDIERDRRETEQYGYTKPAYYAAIRALCVPSPTPMAVRVSPRAAAEPLAAQAA